MSSAVSPLEQSSPRRPGLVVALFLLAPLVGEFLLGNLPVTWLWTLLTLAPMYGGGAILVRETARRWRLGWPAIVLLGFAYGVLEEAFVTQSLFNPNYVGLRLLDYGFLPALGIGSWWTVFVLSLHGIWSTAVPIAVMESFDDRSPPAPWLGPIGTGITVLIFGLGCFATARFQPAAETGASASQLIASAVVIVGLVAAAFFFGRSRSAGAVESSLSLMAPRPIAVGALTLVGGSLFMGLAMVLDGIPAMFNVGGMLLILGVIVGVLLRWSRRASWSALHRLAAASGFVLTYVWYGFVQVPSVGEISPAADAVGNMIFSVAAIALLTAAYLRIARRSRETVTRSG